MTSDSLPASLFRTTGRMARGVLAGVLLLSFALPGISRGAASLPEAKRIVFLGDSITYSGEYIDYLDACLRTRFPEREFELLDLGLPSETVSGLSEPGHAGGAFPRPDLHERLDRVLVKTKPDLIIACYGMNDGIYFPFSDERFAKYQDGVQRLVQRAAKDRIPIILLTPPTFDPIPLKEHTLPAGRTAYPMPYHDYNQVLDRYADWLLAQRSQGWTIIDIHGPMNHHLAARRRQTPDYLLAGDGVHANAFGHWLFTQQILVAWNVPAEVDTLDLDARIMKVRQGQISELTIGSQGIQFSWRTRLPMPFDPQWDPQSVALERIADRFNRHRLIVRGAPALKYNVFESDRLLGTFSHDQLAQGIDLLQFPSLLTNERGAKLLKLIHQRQRLLTDAWLTDTGHRRPGMNKGLPLATAQEQAAALNSDIRELSAPIRLRWRLTPVDATHAPAAGAVPSVTAPPQRP